MKRLLIVLLALVIIFNFSGLVNAQVTKIKDIQFTNDASGDSPLKDQVVTISGIVTAEPYAFGGSYYFVQDSSGAWSGIKVYDKNRQVAQGDSVTLTGKVAEYNGVSEITNVSSFEINSSAGRVVMPVVVATGEIGTGGVMAEAFEGVLVQVKNVGITNPNLGYGEWEINDGSGACRVDDAAKYYFDPADFDSAKSITGVLDYTHNDTKILPRLAYDIVETGGIIRLQRIQQVRYSDLLKTPESPLSDFSYLSGDTVTVTGVVTMPTGLSYAGAGIKFIFGDPKGGPWSAILSYHPDSTAYPSLFEGDIIKMTGYIGEYSTGTSNMTEFWITSPIELLDLGKPLPPVDTVKTGDLRLPVTAEQWGNVMIAVKNAEVKNLTPQFELFSIDDKTGEVLVDDDSDSLTNYPDPPQGTILQSVRGWIYHHYGSYADSTSYKLEPLYKTDIVLGKAPPAISQTKRTPEIPTDTNPVEVTTTVKTNSTLSSVDLYYRVNGGAFQMAAMQEVTATQYKGEIPPQSLGSFVDYFVKATDVDQQATIEPYDTTLYTFCYPVTDGNLAIADIQYTPWKLANSPFEGMKVAVTGVVTCDTTMNNRYAAYSIQDGTGEWNGLYVFGIKQELSKGDQVKVYGTVTDYNADWHFKWDNNTVILADSFKVMATGQTVPSVNSVPTGDLSGNAAHVENHEGTLVRVSNATITSINSYDFTVDDGSGPCLIDDDALPSGVATINRTGGFIVLWGDTLHVGDVVDYVQGVFTFSFGTFKIELRDANDAGIMTGVNDDLPNYPITYQLEQNFPNPFNPETRLYFSVPNTSNVKIVIYNSLGQQVRILTDATFPAGRHVLNWDGRNEEGQLLPSGMYLYRMKAGDFIDLKKMMLLK